MIRAVVLLLLGMLFLAPAAGLGAESEGDSTRLVPAPERAIRLELDSGRTILVTSVRVRSSGVVHFTRAGAPDSTLPAKHVRTITDEYGGNRTRDVLYRGGTLKVGDPDTGREWKIPPEVRGTMVGVRLSDLLPIRAYHGDAANGFGLETSFEIRTSRHVTWGGSLEFTQWGGDEDHERDIALATSGQIDQIRFTAWGPSVSYRALLFTDRRINPYLQTRLGIRLFTTSIEGPSIKEHDRTWALAQDYVLGANVRISRTYALDLLVAHSGITVSGTFEYLRFGVGLVRRFPR